MAASRQETQVAFTLSLGDRLRTELLSWLGWGILQFIGRTSRTTSHWTPAVRELFEKNRPFIYAFWHRYQLFMVWEHRNRGVNVLVSQSRDGELIARILRRFGFNTVRGSSSRGGAGAFRSLLRVLRAGGRPAFTPDGPRGPFHSIQPGVLALAAQTGIPIVPLAWAGTRVKVLNNWDRFLVPLPFGRYAVALGDPLIVTEDDPAAAERLRGALARVEEEAAARLNDPC